MPQTPSRRSLAIRITSLREKCGLSQRRLARKLGKGSGTVSRWERGVASPNAENLRSLTAALGCSPDFLLSGRNPPLRSERLPELEELKRRLATIETSAREACSQVEELGGGAPREADPPAARPRRRRP